MARRKAKIDSTVSWGEGSTETVRYADGSTGEKARWHEYEGGRRVSRTKTFRDLSGVTAKERAEDHLRAIGRSVRAGQYVPDSDMTIADLIGEYVKRGRRRWSSNTTASYQTLIDKWILPRLGKRKVVGLKPRVLQTFFDDLHEAGNGASQINNIRIILSGALNEAVVLEVIKQSPLAGIAIATKRQHKINPWTMDETRKVLDACKGDSATYAFYLVALTTGVRPGEIRALKWSDFDERRRTITVRRTMTRADNFTPIIGETTKTGEGRVIVIPQETVDALKALRVAQNTRRLAHGNWLDLDLIFDRGNGNFLGATGVSLRHRRVCDAAGVRCIRQHDLRHTYATLELEGGTSIKIVSERLGHRKVQITMDMYMHVSEDLQRATADAFMSRLLYANRR